MLRVFGLLGRWMGYRDHHLIIPVALVPGGVTLEAAAMVTAQTPTTSHIRHDRGGGTRLLREPVSGGYALNARLGAGAGDDVAFGHVQRPTWRGIVHVVALIVAVPAMSVLVVHSDGGVRARGSVVVYALGVCATLAVSAIYHRWVHRLRTRCAWRRADHATIFAAIAGSSTPTIVATVPTTTAAVLVAVTWSSALVGAGCKLSRWHGGNLAGTAMYAVTIACGTVAVPWVWTRAGVAPAVLLVAGGGVYLVGAACFAARWPTLRATVFSYHEVWHVFTVVAAASHFAAVWIMIS